MVTKKRSIQVCLWACIVSILAILTCHLALTDIRHGEADLSLEWAVLQVGFLIIIAFHALALITLGRLLGRST